jgi:hypothetical protein
VPHANDISRKPFKAFHAEAFIEILFGKEHGRINIIAYHQFGFDFLERADA